MVSALLIALREGLEAALLVSIVLGYLARVGDRKSTWYAWTGVAVAVALSVILAVGMRIVGAELEAPWEQIFGGTTMFLAVGILTWMLFWMRYRSRYLKRDLERQISSAIKAKQGWAIFALTFVTVLREGLETALFLAANAFAADPSATLIGALVGLVIATAAGAVIYVYAVRLNLSLFFNVTSVLLMVFAAGLAAHGVGEFQAIGMLPFTGIAWDTKALLDVESILGSLLHALVGYNDQPSILEVLTYIGYWVIVLQAIRWWSQRLATRLVQEHA